MHHLFLLLLTWAAIACSAASCAAAEQRMNLLLLISDDLRCEMGCYGSPLAKTPRLDQLAASSVRFDKAYCQFPLCNPSRSSVLTGLRPTSTRVLGNRTWVGATRPDALSLVQHFRNHGYATLRAGKVFHGGIDDTAAWTRGGRARYFGAGATAAPPAHDERGPTGKLLSKIERSDRWIALQDDGHDHEDYRIADRAIGYLRESNGEPFFLACGFHKPHSPLVAPQRFFDLFDLDDIPLPPDYSPRPTIPEGFPAGAIRQRNADLFVGRASTPETAREMIRAYLAASSWMDWNAGRVLDELEKLGLADRTIVLFWGDHGYQLGEKGKWSKAGSLWEQGARTPLLIRDPRSDAAGKVCPRVVEALDIYPTLCDLCGLEAPQGLEGRSLAPFLKNPNRASDRPAYTVWSEDGRHVTGVCVRTARWRYAEFFGSGAGRMLTDPVHDPHELVNLADLPEHAERVRAFSDLARTHAAGWTPPAANTPIEDR